MLKREPRYDEKQLSLSNFEFVFFYSERPSVNTILRKPFLSQRIPKHLEEEV
jgi:hypothetical protein